MGTKINQIVALQKGLQARTLHAVSEIYHNLQKAPLFAGLARRYEPLEDGGETLPPESVLTQASVEKLLADASQHLIPLFDVVATKEKANMVAEAPVMLDGVQVLPPMPVPFLLFLEKQLHDLRTIVAKAPVLDPAEVWVPDADNGGFRTPEVRTQKTRKQQEVLVKYPATDKHPAQTEVISVDKIVGHWITTKFSGALPRERRAEIVARIDAMGDAVKKAREEANNMEITQVSVGSDIFLHLLG